VQWRSLSTTLRQPAAAEHHEELEPVDDQGTADKGQRIVYIPPIDRLDAAQSRAFE